MNSPVIVLFAAISIAVPASALQELYVRAAIDANGNLRVDTARQRVFLLDAERNELGSGEPLEFVKIALSPDGLAVGWLISIHNYAAIRFEYYSDGQRRSIPQDTAIWGWAFVGGGTRVALKKRPLSVPDDYYELWDLVTMRRLEVFSPASKQPAPDWAKDLQERQ